MKAIYRDIWVRVGGSLLTAHFIGSLGRPESFFQQLTTQSYYIDLFFGSLIAFTLWTWVRQVTVSLDRRHPWFQKGPQRLLLQAFFGLVLPLLLCFFLTFLFMRLVWQQDIFTSGWMYNEFPVAVLILLLINGGYFTYWLYDHVKRVRQEALKPAMEPEAAVEAPLAESPPRKAGFIEVPKAGKIILLKTGDLAYAYLKEGYCYLKTHSAESFVTTYALDDLFELLDEEEFFRANRQLIINKKACRSYNSLEYGKIGLELEPAFREPVVVSQKRAKAFREWIAVPT